MFFSLSVVKPTPDVGSQQVRKKPFPVSVYHILPQFQLFMTGFLFWGVFLRVKAVSR